MSWKPEVLVSGEWSSNGLRFETAEEAAQYASDLFSRWTLTTNFRAVESTDPVNYTLKDNQLRRIQNEPV